MDVDVPLPSSSAPLIRLHAHEPTNPRKRKTPPARDLSPLPDPHLILSPEPPKGEYETGRVICEVCGEGVSFRDEASGGFTLKHWDAHRQQWYVISISPIAHIISTRPPVPTPHRPSQSPSSIPQRAQPRPSPIRPQNDAVRSGQKKNASTTCVLTPTSPSSRPIVSSVLPVTNGFACALIPPIAPFHGTPIERAAYQRKCEHIGHLSRCHRISRYTETPRTAMVWKSVIRSCQRTLTSVNSTPSVSFATSAISGFQSAQRTTCRPYKNGCNIAQSARNPSLHRLHLPANQSLPAALGLSFSVLHCLYRI